MNTEYTVGKIRIHFESRARRRCFVAFFYAVLALAELAGFFVSTQNAIPIWLNSGCLILFVVLWIVFSGLSGDMRERGDEREALRRDHAHFSAYRFFLYVLMVALFIGPIREPNPLAPPAPLAFRGILVQPNFLAISAFLLYLTLPQAILLWTEPDMEESK